MDSDSLKADLSALAKLYRLLQINESSDPSTVSKTLDEGSQVFLKKLLDGASERVFEAHVKIMADNWRNLFDKKYMGQVEETKETETLQHAANSSNLEQIIKARVCAVIKNEQPPDPSSVPSVTAQVRRFTSELQSRRKKRCLACERSSKLQETSKAQSNEIKEVVTKARDLRISDQGLEEKKPFEPVRNTNMPGSKRMDGRYYKSSDKESVASVEDFSKEVDDAIRRMESLIPSLHQLSKPVAQTSGKILGNPDSSKNVTSALDSDAVGSSRNLAGQIQSYKGKQTQRCSGSSRSNSNADFPSRHHSVAGKIPDHNQGLRTPSSRYGEDGIYQYQSRPTRERNDAVQHRGRKPLRTTHGSYLSQLNESEETCSESTGSSSWSTNESSSATPPSYTSRTTTSSSGENDNSEYSGDIDYQDVGSESSKTEYVTSQSSSRYGSSSYNASDYRDGDSEYYQPSRRHSFVHHTKPSKFSRIKNTLGFIFHHHHLHHHHHHGKRGGSAWKGFGGIFRHKGKKGGAKNHMMGGTETAGRKKGKQLAKSGPRKRQMGHFRALVDGMIGHARRSSQPKRRGKKPNLWQSRVKVANVARVRLQGKKKKKPRLAAPKS